MGGPSTHTKSDKVAPMPLRFARIFILKGKFWPLITYPSQNLVTLGRYYPFIFFLIFTKTRFPVICRPKPWWDRNWASMGLLCKIGRLIASSKFRKKWMSHRKHTSPFFFIFRYSTVKTFWSMSFWSLMFFWNRQLPRKVIFFLFFVTSRVIV